MLLKMALTVQSVLERKRTVRSPLLMSLSWAKRSVSGNQIRLKLFVLSTEGAHPNPNEFGPPRH